MTAPLAHLRVLELGESDAAASCGKLFATYGARVIKIERPSTGDRARSIGPFAGEPSVETSVPFLWLNMGKESVTCDLESPEGRDLTRALALTCDVVIESFTPGALEGTGLSYQALAAERPPIVMTSVTPFGQDGPYSHYSSDEIVSYATGGGMHLTGEPQREPLAAGVRVASASAGMAAFVGTLAAVFAAGTTGRGDHVDVSIQEAMLDNVETAIADHLHTGRVPKRTGDRHDLVPWGLYRCRDGWAAVVGGPVRHWAGAVGMFEEPRLADERFRHIAGRMQHRQEFEALIQPWLDEHDREEVVAAGRAHGLAFGALHQPEEVLDDDQHRARAFFQRLDHPVAGEQTVAREPFRFTDAPAELRRAPLLGEHTAAVLIEDLALSRSEFERLTAAGIVTSKGGDS